MCEYCGHTPCKPKRLAIINTPVLREAMTAEDWRDIYHFLRYVQLPYVHAICQRALRRKETEEAIIRLEEENL